MKPTVFADTKHMSRQDWLKARRAGIGGSDAAAILGLNPFSSPMSVWAEKVSDAEPEELRGNESVWLGNVLEEHVARRYAEETGLPVVRCNKMLQHPKYPFMLANIDRRIRNARIGIEIKTTSMMNKTDFANGQISPWYYVQCMHYLAVTGWKEWLLLVLVIGKGLYSFTIDRDEKEIRSLVKAEEAFWNGYVKTGKMPPADGSQAAAKAIALRFPASDGTAKELTCDAAVRRYVNLDMQIRSLEAEKEVMRQQIQTEMGTAETGTVDGFTVSWKSAKPRVTLDSKRLSAEMPEVYSRYCRTGEGTRRFIVSAGRGA